MAQPALDWFRKRGVLVKAEGTEGTDSVPVAGTDGIMLMNGKAGTEFDKVERPIDRSFFTSDPFAVANKRAFIEGDFELYSPLTPGAAATSSADCEQLLLIAGMTVVKTLGTKTTRYNPISASIPSASAYWYQVDHHVKALGARANISNLKMEIGKIFMGSVRIQGTYTAFSTVSLPAITYPTYVPTVATYANSTAVLNGVTVWCKKLEINFNNELGAKEYTSVLKHQISARKATWSMRIARTDLADLNPWTLRDAGTIITGTFTKTGEQPVSGVATAKLAFRGQIEQIEATEIDGDYGWDLSGPCVASNTGGDEFYIEFDDT